MKPRTAGNRPAAHSANWGSSGPRFDDDEEFRDLRYSLEDAVAAAAEGHRQGYFVEACEVEAMLDEASWARVVECGGIEQAVGMFRDFFRMRRSFRTPSVQIALKCPTIATNDW